MKYKESKITAQIIIFILVIIIICVLSIKQTNETSALVPVMTGNYFLIERRPRRHNPNRYQFTIILNNGETNIVFVLGKEDVIKLKNTMPKYLK